MAEIAENEVISEHEDGEITDDDEGPIELPVHSQNLLIDYPSSEDENPEELLAKIAKKAADKKVQEPEVAIDPKLCVVCKKNEHKYRCPRCNLRSCSLDCSKQHKIDNDCDGVRQPFTAVQKLSQYDGQKSIDDQKFIHGMKEKAGLGAENASSCGTGEITCNSDGETEKDPNALRYTTNSGTERYLINAARYRRIRLGFSNSGEGESRHEQFSDTIFWTLKITFRKEKDGEVEEFEKIINNIPETIRIVTVLKQFFKPRKFGCIVSESDLDMEKMEPFIQKGYENVNVFMQVHGYPDKFYGISGESTILENTRNRVIADHPKLIVTLDNEFVNMQLLSQEEMDQIATKYGGVSGGERFGGGGGGRGRGGGGGGRGGGFHRGGGGGMGGGRGGGNFQRKRPAQQGGNNGGYDNNWKRPRGGGGNNGGQRRGFNNRSHHQNADSFDPFEPFSGPSRLPIEYGSSSNKD